MGAPLLPLPTSAVQNFGASTSSSASPNKKTKTDHKHKKNKKRKDGPSTACFVLRPKKNKEGRRNSMPISLHGLLEYDSTDTAEQTFEVSLMAEVFQEMLIYTMAKRLLAFLLERQKNPPPPQKASILSKASQTAAAPAASKKEEVEEYDPTNPALTSTNPEDNSEDSTESEEDEQPAEESPPAPAKPSKEVLEAFKFFDDTRAGFLKQPDVELALLSLDAGLSKHQARKLVNLIADRDSKLYYTRFFSK